MYHFWILNASADINTQVEQIEQGTVSVETAFCNQCNLNLVSFHCTFQVYVCTILVSECINTQVGQSEQGTVSVETTFCNQCNLNLVSFIIHSWFTCVIQLVSGYIC